MILWGDPPAATPSPGELATALRELLSASRVERVDQPGGDRVMRLVLSRGGKAGPTRELIVELFGRMGRLVVIEGGSRRVLLVSGRGGVGRGDPYVMPDGARDLDPAGPTATMPFDPIQAIPSDQRGGEAPLHQWLFPRLQQREQQNHLRTLLRVEQQSLNRALKLLRRRVRKLDQDLEAGALWQQWQRYGELLKGNIPSLSRGMNSIEVQDWYQEGAPLVEIPLEKDAEHRALFSSIEKRKAIAGGARREKGPGVGRHLSARARGGIDRAATTVGTAGPPVSRSVLRRGEKPGKSIWKEEAATEGCAARIFTSRRSASFSQVSQS